MSGVNLAATLSSPEKQNHSSPPQSSHPSASPPGQQMIDPIALLINAGKAKLALSQRSHHHPPPTSQQHQQSPNTTTHPLPRQHHQQQSPHSPSHHPHPHPYHGRYPAPPQHLVTIQVQVPYNLPPNRQMVIRTPAGYPMSFLVPEGVLPGMVIPVNVPVPNQFSMPPPQQQQGQGQQRTPLPYQYHMGVGGVQPQPPHGSSNGGIISSQPQQAPRQHLHTALK
mmetsp:Transcript_17254/g.21522  ORF Transcript_17254/g.21522 Transcript_17254/m.21522 type:complete len:224 (+) Transcript_17254:184-855(+)